MPAALLAKTKENKKNQLDIDWYISIKNVAESTKLYIATSKCASEK